MLASQLIEVEAFRAVDRERLLGNLDDTTTAIKRKELVELLAMLDLVPIDARVIALARSSFAVNVRALDAMQDLEHCQRCGGALRWVEAATTVEAISRLLAKHGLRARAPPAPRAPFVPQGQLRFAFIR